MQKLIPNCLIELNFYFPKKKKKYISEVTWQ